MPKTERQKARAFTLARKRREAVALESLERMAAAKAAWEGMGSDERRLLLEWTSSPTRQDLWPLDSTRRASLYLGAAFQRLTGEGR